MPAVSCQNLKKGAVILQKASISSFIKAVIRQLAGFRPSQTTPTWFNWIGAKSSRKRRSFRWCFTWNNYTINSLFCRAINDLYHPVTTCEFSPAHKHWLDVITSINFGNTISCAAFASATGVPKAALAAETACVTNPITIIYPCHRVVRRNDTFGNNGEGSQLSQSKKHNVGRKAFFIAHENS